MARPQLDLDPEQQAEARRLFEILQEATRDDLWRIAQLMASKDDRHLLGQAEFEVRDVVHRIGAEAIQAAVNRRKKGGTAGPA
jgi:hypothetical protein